MIDFIQHYWISIIISIFIIIIQLKFFVSAIKNLQYFKKFIPEKDFNENDILTSDVEENLKLIKNNKSAYISEFYNLIESINNYLTKNKGVIDFAVVQSLIERNIKSNEEIASSNVSLPLYIGLMGTFCGIILGLLNIADSGVTDSNINSFIGGVIIAMVASFFGLLFTVINNFWNLKNAKSTVEIRKNVFLNFIQTELLPHLQSNLYQALDILRVNINNFNEKFETNIKLFDNKFTTNINNLKESADKISGGMNQIVENTEIQKDYLKEFKSLNFIKLSKANLEFLNQIKESAPLFTKFIEKQKQLNNTVTKTETFILKIDNLLNRISTFEDSINNLGEHIKISDYMGSDVIMKIQKSLDHLDNEREILRQHGDTSSQTIRSFFEEESEKIKQLTVNIRQHSNNTNDSIKDFFEDEKKKIKDLTNNIKEQIENALKFDIENNPLQKLNLLENINNYWENIDKHILNKVELKEILNNINNEVSSLIKEIQSFKETDSTKTNTSEEKKTDPTDITIVKRPEEQKTDPLDVTIVKRPEEQKTDPLDVTIVKRPEEQKTDPPEVKIVKPTEEQKTDLLDVTIENPPEKPTTDPQDVTIKNPPKKPTTDPQDVIKPEIQILKKSFWDNFIKKFSGR
jgi:biopolymer transport protein ExbB/TolQ